MSEETDTMGPIKIPSEKDPAFEEIQAGRLKDVQLDRKLISVICGGTDVTDR